MSDPRLVDDAPRAFVVKLPGFRQLDLACRAMQETQADVEELLRRARVILARKGSAVDPR